MRTLWVVLAIVLSVAAPAVAGKRDGQPELGYDQGWLAVRGQGTVSVAPDLAYIQAGVEVRAETAAEAQAAVAQRVAAALEQLWSLGATEDDVRTVQIGVYPEWKREQGDDEPRLIGYRAVHQLRLTVRDIDAVGQWLDTLVQNGVNRVNGVTFAVSDTTAARDEALRLAVLDARKKAEIAASAAGVALGRVLEMQLEGAAAPSFPGAERVAFSAAGMDTQVYPGEVEFVSSVSITFALRERCDR